MEKQGSEKKRGRGNESEWGEEGGGTPDVGTAGCMSHMPGTGFKQFRVTDEPTKGGPGVATMIRLT